MSSFFYVLGFNDICCRHSLHDSKKEVDNVEVEIPELYEGFQDFIEDRKNLVHQNFPISCINKQNIIGS